MATIKLLSVFALLTIISAPGYARSSEESQFLLKEAMMDSNADYNKHKKQMNMEEYDRADDWSDRDTQAIMIDGTHSDFTEFKELKEDQPKSNREVSSHQTHRSETVHD